jgi:hypothetical protein
VINYSLPYQLLHKLAKILVNWKYWTNQWTSVLDQGGVLHTIYMDFMKAFDKVPHKRFLYKDKHYGISERTCNWIESFFNNRHQCVCKYVEGAMNVYSLLVKLYISHLSGWNLRSHNLLQLKSSSRSFCIIFISDSSEIVRTIFVSSANINASLTTLFGIWD